MLRYGLAATAALIAAVAVAWVSFLLLQRECSLENSREKTEAHSQQDGTNKNGDSSDASKQTPEPDKTNAQRPTGTFQLEVTGPNKIEGDYHTQTGDGEKGNWVHKFVCETKIGELSLAILTFVLVLFTGLLWASTDILGRITNESHQANIATQAASILPGNFLIRALLNPDGIAGAFEFRIEWINQGNTRADQAIFHINWAAFLAERGVPENFPFGDEGALAQFGTYLGPKATTYSAPIAISVAEIEAVRVGQLALIFYGWTRYRDIFDVERKHITRFCTELIQIDGDPYIPGGVNLGWHFRQFPRYSCIDEECPQQDRA